MNVRDEEASHGPALTLAHSEIGQVTLCPCGNVTVTMQCVSIRFEPDAFRTLAQMLGHSLSRIDRFAVADRVVEEEEADAPLPWPQTKRHAH